jgi:hypothetical protein
MLLRNIIVHLPTMRMAHRMFSTSMRIYSKEFTDRSLQSYVDVHDSASTTSALLHIRSSGHRVYIIQPSMKFKARGRQTTTAQLQLTESISLIETLNKWSVAGHGIYTLKTSGATRYLYGKGNIEKMTEEIHQCQATAVFISIDRLSLAQIDGLTEKFRVPVYDRYGIVLQVDSVLAIVHILNETWFYVDIQKSCSKWCSKITSCTSRNSSSSLSKE